MAVLLACFMLAGLGRAHGSGLVRSWDGDNEQTRTRQLSSPLASRTTDSTQISLQITAAPHELRLRQDYEVTYLPGDYTAVEEPGSLCGYITSNVRKYPPVLLLSCPVKLIFPFRCPNILRRRPVLLYGGQSSSMLLSDFGKYDHLGVYLHHSQYRQGSRDNYRVIDRNAHGPDFHLRFGLCASNYSVLQLQ